jgi:F-type H+-transporting ATPase subunit epsilon
LALELVVVTPEGEALSEVVDQVVLPGEAGEFGVLESHERFLTPLVPGPMRIHSSDASRWAAISSGFAEVDGSRVVVLVDACTLAGEIDPEIVQARRADAQNALAALQDGEQSEAERARLAALIVRAEVELDVASR